MHILHTVLYKFPVILTRRICLMIKSILVFFISYILITLLFQSEMKLLGEIRFLSPLRPIELKSWFYAISRPQPF